jgi:thymidylate synthase (FAD)
MRVRPISISTPIAGAVPGANDDPEALMVYCARISNPSNQWNHATGSKLLRYCIKHKHWSVLEMVDWCVEVETTRAIASQLLRHRSFSFQEFSQRYSDIRKLTGLIQQVEMRPANPGGNRQGSDEVEPLRHPTSVNELVEWSLDSSIKIYERLLEEGVAPECARMVLPLATTTKLYVKGSVRSWVHYLQVRTTPHTQKEHRDLAQEIQRHFANHFPVVAEAAFHQEDEE